MREEHYRKRHQRGPPEGPNERQYQNKHSKNNLVFIDTPNLSQPSSQSDSDAEGKALGMKSNYESSAYPHEVPSAFDNV